MVKFLSSSMNYICDLIAGCLTYQMCNNFAIAGGGECVLSFQTGLQGLVVVDFTIHLRRCGTDDKTRKFC